MQKGSGRSPADSPLRLTPDRLTYDLISGESARVSPDGERVVFVVRRAVRGSARDRRELWLLDVRDGHRAPVVPGNGSVRGATFSPDSGRLAIATEDEHGGRVIVVPVSGSEPPRELGRHPGGVSIPVWAPDGQRVAYTADAVIGGDTRDGGEFAGGVPRPWVARRIDYKRDGRGWLGEQRAHLFVADVHSAKLARLTSEAIEHMSPVWSADGRFLAVGQDDWTNETSRLLIVDVEGNVERVISWEDGFVHAWTFTLDGSGLIIAGGAPWSGQPEYVAYDLATGVTRPITTDLACLPDQHGPLIWLDGERLLFGGVERALGGLFVLNVNTGDVSTLTSAHARRSQLSVDAADTVAVQVSDGPDHVGEICLTDLKKTEQRLLTAHNAAVLNQAGRPDLEHFTVARADAIMDAWLVKPPDFDNSYSYPVVLHIHGGPQWHYGPWFQQEWQLLAAAGFLVVYANPRGSTSYGRRWTELLFQDWGPGPFADVMSALDTVLARPYADETRVGITGGSYGAYLTAYSLGQTERFRAAVTVRLAFDLVSQQLTGEEDSAVYRHNWGERCPETWDKLVAQSPHSYADRIRTPTLLLHGEVDASTPLSQSEEMFHVLVANGIEAEIVCYPGGSHGFITAGAPAHRVDALERMIDWFQRHLGGPTRDASRAG